MVKRGPSTYFEERLVGDDCCLCCAWAILEVVESVVWNMSDGNCSTRTGRSSFLGFPSDSGSMAVMSGCPIQDSDSLRLSSYSFFLTPPASTSLLIVN